MPAETLHTTHQGPNPGETVTESGIILPAGVDRQKNVRETIQFDNLDSRSTKYNSAGVDPNNPYNAFAPEAPQPEAAAPDYAADQPRRSRTNPESGATEKLVKYSNGELAWVSSDEAPTFEKGSGEQEAQPALHQEVLENVASGIDGLEQSNEKQDEEISELKKLLAEQSKQIAALTAQLESLLAAQTKDTEDAEAGDTIAEQAPKYPGQEVELYKPKELVVIEPTNEDTPLELVEVKTKELEAVAPEIEEEGPKKIGLAQELYDEIEQGISEVRDKYAELTAKNRQGYAGHFLKDDGLLSRLLKKLPGAERAADWINEKVDRELNEARIAYEETVHDMQKQVIDGIVEQYGDDPEVLKQARMIAGDIAIKADMDFEIKATSVRMDSAGSTNKFINWWVQQDGLGGKLKKAALVAGAGLTAGAVAGLIGVPLVGLAAGVAIGAGTGVYATKKRASGISEKGGTNTLAEKQSQEDAESKGAYAKAQIDSEDGFVRVSDLTKITEQRTADEKASNRSRVKAATAAGAAGAGIGNGLGSLAREGIDNAINNIPEPEAPETPEPEVPATPEAPAAPELQGLNFDVQSGSGYTQELMDFAQANGHALTPDQSFELHQGLMNQFGTDYININGGGNDVYFDGGDARLTMPGSATWNDGVGQFVQQWMTTRGLW